MNDDSVSPMQESMDRQYERDMQSEGAPSTTLAAGSVFAGKSVEQSFSGEATLPKGAMPVIYAGIILIMAVGVAALAGLIPLWIGIVVLVGGVVGGSIAGAVYVVKNGTVESSSDETSGVQTSVYVNPELTNHLPGDHSSSE